MALRQSRPSINSGDLQEQASYPIQAGLAPGELWLLVDTLSTPWAKCTAIPRFLWFLRLPLQFPGIACFGRQGNCYVCFEGAMENRAAIPGPKTVLLRGNSGDSALQVSFLWPKLVSDRLNFNQKLANIGKKSAKNAGFCFAFEVRRIYT